MASKGRKSASKGWKKPSDPDPSEAKVLFFTKRTFFLNFGRPSDRPSDRPPGRPPNPPDWPRVVMLGGVCRTLMAYCGWSLVPQINWVEVQQIYAPVPLRVVGFRRLDCFGAVDGIASGFCGIERLILGRWVLPILFFQIAHHQKIIVDALEPGTNSSFNGQ